MTESNPRRDAAGDDELTAMCGAMVRAAQSNQIASIVPAPFRTQLRPTAADCANSRRAHAGAFVLGGLCARVGALVLGRLCALQREA
ncbi:MAG TPA: hypothetical protein VH062_15315 [Polyangiaceae bacterium]|jgi:hypothetical protein|nr:hypothetical protein [Polyangiaceae bacterium]